LLNPSDVLIGALLGGTRTCGSFYLAGLVEIG